MLILQTSLASLALASLSDSGCWCQYRYLGDSYFGPCSPLWSQQMLIILRFMWWSWLTPSGVFATKQSIITPGWTLFVCPNRFSRAYESTQLFGHQLPASVKKFPWKILLRVIFSRFLLMWLYGRPSLLLLSSLTPTGWSQRLGCKRSCQLTLLLVRLLLRF